LNSGNQENSHAESSFYEDQLDNELEGLSLQSRDHSKQENSDKESIDKPDDSDTSLPPRKVAFTDDNINTTHNTNSLQTKSNKTKSSKTASSNHHVSFNINNAIYSTRQEIPISIIKGTSQNQSHCSGANSKQPIQSSLKKSTTSATLQSDQQKTGFFHASSKQGQRTSDTKTTIL